MPNPLYVDISIEKKAVRKYKPDIIEVPMYIANNLKYPFYEWQQNAFENFLLYQADHKQEPTHLMFNMATGTGKTLLMAAMILYYYKQGYRHFMFFVNQNNIIDKTENNFMDCSHNKYLFQNKIVIDNNTVNLKKVDTFSDNPQGIEIKFTSIHQLYEDIHLERENQTTLDDLHKKDIVMLADEAHCLNANTKNIELGLDIKDELKQSTNKNEVVKKGWEHTVIELILNKNGNSSNNKNVLLEFTATIPNNESVAKKYNDKIVYKFDLKDFLLKGYTKEINLLSSTLGKKERILQALLFNWYRHEIGVKHGLMNFKPVVLFRSKTIAESKEDHKEFIEMIKSLSRADFDFCKSILESLPKISQNQHQMGESRVSQILNYINKNSSYSKIVEFLKYNFREQNVIITNSKTNKTQTENTTEEQESLLNNLEDKNNHIRAIFTVNRLTEGWDVLNLYDIVRLYQEQIAGGSTKKTPEATTKEKQLIGRGVRYYPFDYNGEICNKRKFDSDLDNELRVLEELFYYTFDEKSRYISHLKEELKKDGYIQEDSDKIVKKFDLKASFKASEDFKKLLISGLLIRGN